MGCITCGSQFAKTFNDIVKQKKKEFETYKIDYYVYRQNESKVWSIARKDSFKVIYERDKPTEYFHISEFKTS